MRRLPLLLLLAPTLCFGQLWSGVINSSRGTDWTHAGISGGIPSASWSQCGATISAYTGSAATIANALNRTGSGYTGCSANTYIQLAAGTFTFTGTGTGGICISGVNGTELRGMGADQTHLVMGNSLPICQNGNGVGALGFESTDSTGPLSPPANIYNVTTAPTQGAFTVVVSSSVNITANSTLVYIDQCDTGYSGTNCAGSSVDNGGFFMCADAYNPSGPLGCSVNGPDGGFARPHRWQEELHTVASCSPACGTAGTTTLTLNEPIVYPQWSLSLSPQIWLVQPEQNIGIQNLSIDVSNCTSCNVGGISFTNVLNWWVQGVSVLNAYNIGIFETGSSHGIVQSNYVYNAGQNLTYNDPTGIKYNGSYNLIANNIVQKVRPATMCEGPCTVNVVTGTYAINSYTAQDFLFGNSWDGHSAGASYNLTENSFYNQLGQDMIHGGHLMETYLRNFTTGWESCANGQCGSFTAKDSNTEAIGSQYVNRYMNWIYDVVGTPGYHNAYSNASLCASQYELNQTIWATGCANGGGSVFIPSDPKTNQSSLRWGNWDVVTGATQYNASEVPSGFSPYPNSTPTACTNSTSCPASFYYSSRPSWWASSIPWPAIGPDVTGGNVGQCAGTLNVSGQQNGVPATSSAQCTGSSLTSAWGGHVYAIPAMACYLNVMHGPPDGSGSALTFSASSCYGAGTPTVSNPTFSPLPGTYSSTQTVTLSSATAGATICYTTDGTTPTATTPGTCSHGTTYSTAITVSSTTTINAIGTLSGDTNSGVSTGTYSIVTQAATPVFTPGSGSYSSGTAVTISTSSSGCGPYIYWSSVDNPPTPGDNNSTSFSVLANATIYAAVLGCPGFANSATGSATYTVSSGSTVATPVLSPTPGTYPTLLSVSISTATSSAVICYRTDGGTPTATTPGTCDSPAITYSGPFTISSTTTVTAIGTLASYTNSAEASGTYTILPQAATPSFSPGSGTYPYGTSVVISTASSGCSSYIYWSSVHNPPTNLDNNTTMFNVNASATIYAKVIGCPGFGDSAVGSASYVPSLVGPPVNATGNVTTSGKVLTQ